MPRWFVPIGVAAVSAASAACGGIVQTGEPSPTPTSEPQSSAGGASGGSSTKVPTVPLPECTLGFDPVKHPEKACPFTVEGLCYAEKLDACGCACGGRNGTTCTSGFPELSGTVKVTCL